MRTGPGHAVESRARALCFLMVTVRQNMYICDGTVTKPYFLLLKVRFQRAPAGAFGVAKY